MKRGELSTWMELSLSGSGFIHSVIRQPPFSWRRAKPGCDPTLRHARLDMTMYYSHARKRQKRGCSGHGFGGDYVKTGATSGAGGNPVAMIVDRELVYNEELTAAKWALNSAVECHLHTLAIHPPAADSKDV